MAVVTLEDLQGSVDVVVFPRTYAEAGVAAKLADDAVLLFAGRVDHKGDETVVLADSVWTWDEVASMGEGQFAQVVAAGDRGRRGGRRRNGSAGIQAGVSADGNGALPGVAAPAAGGRDERPGDVARPAAPAEVMVIPRVSPLRGSEPAGTITITIGESSASRSAAPTGRSPGPGPSGLIPPIDTRQIDLPPIDVMPIDLPPIDLPPSEAPEPLSGLGASAAFDALAPDGSDEPPLPDDARAAVVRAASAVTTPVEAGPQQVLHIRFGPASDEAIVAAFGQLKLLIKARPGSTGVVLHIPAGAGRSREMRLGVGIAYDADLLAEVERRFDGLLQLTLS
jgi:hypothetical protein